mgnify:FL=1
MDLIFVIKLSTVVCSTGNVIGYEGFNKLSEALERNTTLTSLDISSFLHSERNALINKHLIWN